MKPSSSDKENSEAVESPRKRSRTVLGVSVDQLSSKPAAAAAVVVPTEEGFTDWSGEEIETLLKAKPPGTLRQDIKGQRDWYKDQHLQLKNYAKSAVGMEAKLASEREVMKALQAEQKEIREREIRETKQYQEVLEKNLEEVKGTILENEKQLSEARAQHADVARDFEEATNAIRASHEQVQRLTTEKEKAEAETAAAQEQVASLSETNRKIQEYSNSLQQYNSQLQKDLSASTEAVNKLQTEKTAQQEELGTLKGENTVLQVQLDSTKNSLVETERGRSAAVEEANILRTEKSTLATERNMLTDECKVVKEKLETYEREHDTMVSNLNTSNERVAVLQESYNAQLQGAETMRNDLTVATKRAENAESLCSQGSADTFAMHNRIKELEDAVSRSELQLMQGEEIRRKMHNTIMELKGNIRVFARVRPLTEPEASQESAAAGSAGSILSFPGGLEASTIQVDTGAKDTFSFSFDRVFGPMSSQGAVFEEISQLVQSALDGKKVCVFAYGQTGSGKTHTMMGTSNAETDLAGMVPRSIQQIFNAAAELTRQGWEYNMRASMLEIYNEEIRDLLGNKLPQGKHHNIQHDTKGNTTVTDLTVVDVADYEQAQQLLSKAAHQRSVAKTSMNERSSRSHCVFILRLEGVNHVTGQTLQGRLNLIDLAGSERLSKSGATGDAMKETQAINKSLSSLGDVISSVSSGATHVPFRNSKLTYLLQPCLQGDSKTLMFVNIAPVKDSASESLCSLRFAAKVNSCETATSRKK
ncbi:hypothetical protein CYMTET_13301 [Cymbomonas tetramitiformis]|uniref:Kinesin-like protein n=1 Tax=Cymbomonas tetramitiformis TaxID=36881 RepID=A0AAE0LB75_9CHLO|nr:hypothetical protein CYMTET_13301 [Cymbomonas tetramitiformis]